MHVDKVCTNFTTHKRWCVNAHFHCMLCMLCNGLFCLHSALIETGGDVNAAVNRLL